jgi:DNA-binding HxlR family transcriptional regulator
MNARKPEPAELYGKGTPTRAAIERIANRWTVLVTYALEDGPTRFNELRSRVGVSGQVLTRLLRELERDGLVRRNVYPETPVRIEYELTPLGGTMCSVVHAIRDWAESTAPTIEASRAAADRPAEISGVTPERG